MASGGPFQSILWLMILLFYGINSYVCYHSMKTSKRSFSLPIFFPSCGSHYFLHFLLVLPWRVIMQVWLPGIFWVEKFCEKWNCHGKLGFPQQFPSLFPSTALKQSKLVKDFPPSAVKNQEESQVLRCSFLLGQHWHHQFREQQGFCALWVVLCLCVWAGTSAVTPQL